MEEELKLREMLETLPVAFYATDLNGRLTYLNRAAVGLSGWLPKIGTDQWSCRVEALYARRRSAAA